MIIKVICAACGADNVMRDAWVRWDAASQTWEVAAIYDDGGWCNQCADECELVERPEVLS